MFRKKKSGVYTLLLGNYIVFTLVLVAVVTFLFILFLFRGFNSFMNVYPEQIKSCDPILQKEEYEKFPTEHLLGDSGFITVLDEKGAVIYGQSDFDINLSLNELEYVPNYLRIESISSAELNTRSGGIAYQITVSYLNADSVKITETYIFDEDYRLLFGSGELLKEDLTEKQYKLLTQTYFENYTLSKYSFQNDSGLNYTLLLFQANSAIDHAMDRVGKALMDSFILLLVIYCFMIFGFIFWLKRKITKPLQLLCDLLNHYEVGTDALPIYHGPREFRKIFDSFSAMADRLQKSETDRKNLEVSKQKMLADIAHDLKTPITVVQGYAKALSDGIIPVSEQKTYLNTIEQKATGLNGLINTFYEYSKMEHPDYHLTLEKADICNYLRDYVAEKYTELETEGFAPEVEIPESHIYCSIDKIQLRRVFENIVANTVKHNPKGISIYFNLMEETNHVIITLADNGIGIPPEMKDSLFEPFEVGETSRGNHGSGLGLSIAKKIVEQHKGKIRLIQNTHQYRTGFVIVLPKVL